MKKTCGIYKITSPTNKIYIGQSICIEKRKNRYSCGGCKNQFKIRASIQKHGWKSHKFEIIKECKQEELNYWEIYYINLYDTFGTEHGLNLQKGGLNRKEITDETRVRISQSGKNRYLKYKHPNKDIPMSDEQKEKLRRHNTGKKHTEETRRKMSESAKGKKRTKEHQEKLDEARRGKPPRQSECKYCGIKISFLLVNKYHNENCLKNPNIDLASREAYIKECFRRKNKSNKP